MLLRACLRSIKSILNPRPKCHIRFLTPGRHRKGVIQSLNPEDNEFHGQPTVDISGKRHTTYSFIFNGEFQTITLHYYCKGDTFTPYPTNTLGRLYYRKPSQDRPRVSGSFRFRVLPVISGKPGKFAKGTDLLRPDGRPWEIPLYSAIHSEKKCATLVRKILDEKLLEPELLDVIAELPRIELKVSSGVLYTLSDPFTLSLAQSKFITIITEDHAATFRFRPLIDPPSLHPFTGTILVRFEKSELPEHMNERAVVVRVMEILSPIECVIPDYNFDVQMPAAGKLIAKRSKVRGGYYPWSINFAARSSPAAGCLGLLFPESTPSTPLKC